mmetsp:Transcript_6990/g.16332  ORF Transcript_6990/g.16332 Transcript_6990/m.16332 type:complete len:106 (-) Transcript_6990:2403-2720(-)
MKDLFFVLNPTTLFKKKKIFFFLNKVVGFKTKNKSFIFYIFWFEKYLIQVNGFQSQFKIFFPVHRFRKFGDNQKPKPKLRCENPPSPKINYIFIHSSLKMQFLFH